MIIDDHGGVAPTIRPVTCTALDGPAARTCPRLLPGNVHVLAMTRDLQEFQVRLDYCERFLTLEAEGVVDRSDDGLRSAATLIHADRCLDVAERLLANRGLRCWAVPVRPPHVRDLRNWLIRHAQERATPLPSPLRNPFVSPA